MDRLTVPLEVGKKYVRRNGQVASAREITGTTTHRMFFDQGADAFIATGRVPGLADHPHDIVADYIEPAKGHPHAALMALYAQDAAETDKPWERWEASISKGQWRPMRMGNPLWLGDKQYRRKPKTIRIGEYDVPEPMRVAPERGTVYWVPDLTDDTYRVEFTWAADFHDLCYLSHGLAHATIEGAIAHAAALISQSAVP